MNYSLNLFLSISFLVAVIAGCSSSSESGGSGGSAGAGGIGGVGGGAGAGGEGGAGGDGEKDLEPRDSLSEWGFFADIRNQVPAEGVIPFEVTSPLFTDFAIKHRFVQLRKGIDFDSVDDHPVDLAFALLVPESANEVHLQLLSDLATMFNKEHLRSALRQADTAEALLQLLDRRSQDPPGA